MPRGLYIPRLPVLVADTWTTLSSAEASLYRREGWREQKRKPAGDDGKGKEKRRGSRFFLSPIIPRALSIFRLLLFYWDTLGLLSQCHAAFQQTIPLLMLVPYIEHSLY